MVEIKVWKAVRELQIVLLGRQYVTTYSAVQCSAVQCSAVQCSAVWNIVYMSNKTNGTDSSYSFPFLKIMWILHMFIKSGAEQMVKDIPMMNRWT